MRDRGADITWEEVVRAARAAPRHQTLIGLPVEAGPAETTIAGNLIMQLKGSGEVSSVDEGRAVVARSCPTRRFDPRDPEPWNGAYERFVRQLTVN